MTDDIKAALDTDLVSLAQAISEMRYSLDRLGDEHQRLVDDLENVAENLASLRCRYESLGNPEEV